LEFLTVFEGQSSRGFVEVLNHGSAPARTHSLTVLALTGPLSCKAEWEEEERKEEGSEAMGSHDGSWAVGGEHEGHAEVSALISLRPLE